MTQQVGFVAAFVAGMVSFLSPCVLPLLPVYVSFMTGVSVAELKSGESSARAILGPVLLFVAGFTVVFVAMGASASVLGELLNQNKDLITRVTGVVLMVFGVVLIEPVPMMWLHRGGVDASGFRKFGAWAALLLGMAFPLAMGPCAGPVYGAIITMAIQQASVQSGALLLLVFSLGLALPFVLTSLLLHRLSGVLRFFMEHARLINRVAGGVLVVMGFMMTFGYMDDFIKALEGVLPQITA